MVLEVYHKILIISPGFIFVQKVFLVGWRNFGRAYFRRGFLLEGLLHFKMGCAWEKKKQHKTLKKDNI